MFPLKVLIGLLALAISAWWVWNWGLFFNSDFAMIGLLGERVLKSGEQFIFVPRVGYQGLLIEANLAALFFKAFGVSPQSLHLVAATAFLFFLAVFYFSVKSWFSSFVALLATFFVCLASPLFYGNVIRTQPNYPETFALGCFLFWIYERALITKKECYFFLFCFVSGFGFYLYGQIIYFVASIGICNFWKWKATLSPKIKISPKVFKSFLGIALFFSLMPSLHWGSVRIPGITLAIVLGCVFGLGFLWRCREPLQTFFQKKRKQISKGIVYFLIGYSPTLIYRLVLGKSVFSGFKLVKFSEELWRNALLLCSSGHDFLFGKALGFFSPLLFFGTLALFVWFFWKEAFQVRKQGANPFWVLGLVIFLFFVISRSSGDPFTLRYVLCWHLVSALVWAKVVHAVFRWRVWGAVVLVVFLIFSRLFPFKSIKETYQSTKAIPQLTTWAEVDELVPALRENQVSKGYGDYWAAYLINFVSGGEFMIEPLYSTYLPFYEEDVQKAARIALIKSNDRLDVLPEIDSQTKECEWKGMRYQVVDERILKRWHLWILASKQVPR